MIHERRSKPTCADWLLGVSTLLAVLPILVPGTALAAENITANLPYPHAVYNPAWSSDGTQIAFEYGGPSDTWNIRVYSLSPQGSGTWPQGSVPATPYTHDSVNYAEYPAWSGSSVLFILGQLFPGYPENPALFQLSSVGLVEADWTTVVQPPAPTWLSPTPPREWENIHDAPVLNPAKAEVAISGGWRLVDQIYTVALKSGSPSSPHLTPLIEGRAPFYNRGGTQLVFHRIISRNPITKNAEQAAIFKINLPYSGEPPTQLTDPALDAIAINPFWLSPQEQMGPENPQDPDAGLGSFIPIVPLEISYQCEDATARNATICLINEIGTHRRVLSNLPLITGGRVVSFSWSPDGSRVAFEANGKIWVASQAGTNVVQWSAGPNDRSPKWSPASDDYTDTIAYVSWNAEGTSSDLYVTHSKYTPSTTTCPAGSCKKGDTCIPCQNGCCHGDTCITRPDQNNCGHSGAACLPCAKTQSCVNQGTATAPYNSCQTPTQPKCGPSNCDTCCDENNQCVKIIDHWHCPDSPTYDRDLKCGSCKANSSTGICAGKPLKCQVPCGYCKRGECCEQTGTYCVPEDNDHCGGGATGNGSCYGCNKGFNCDRLGTETCVSAYPSNQCPFATGGCCDGAEHHSGNEQHYCGTPGATIGAPMCQDCSKAGYQYTCKYVVDQFTCQW